MDTVRTPKAPASRECPHARGRGVCKWVGESRQSSDVRKPGAWHPRRRKIRVEVEVPEGLMGEFDLMMHELLVGKRARLDALEQEFKAIETRAFAGLGFILATLRASAGGQSGRLVRFLASLYMKYDYPFEALSDLRTPRHRAPRMPVWTTSTTTGWGCVDLDRHLPDGGAGAAGMDPRLWLDPAPVRRGVAARPLRGGTSSGCRSRRRVCGESTSGWDKLPPTQGAQGDLAEHGPEVYTRSLYYGANREDRKSCSKWGESGGALAEGVSIRRR